MKTKFVFALLLSTACTFYLTAQDRGTGVPTSTDTNTGGQVTTVKPGTGTSPAPGKEFHFHGEVKNEDGTTIFSSKEMGVPIHGTIGKETDKLSQIMDNAMQNMKAGGTYIVEVSKADVTNPGLAAEVTGSKAIFEIDLLDVSDARPNGADEIKNTVSTQGVDAGRTKFDALKASKTHSLDEWDINSSAYELLGSNKVNEAVSMFEMNVELNPTSWNAYDSLGDGYLAKGDKAAAKEMFEQALKINPNFKSSQAKLDKL